MTKMKDEFLYPFEWENKYHLAYDTRLLLDLFPYVLALSGAYLLMIFVGQNWMRHKTKPFHLRTPLAVWNLLLSIFSFCGALRTMPFFLHTLLTRGIYYTICTDPLENGYYGQGGPVTLWVELFIFSKIPELGDTFFLVLRQKPVLFLHWFHHVSVLLFCWHAFGTRTASGLCFVAMNYMVHTVMYSYYFLMCLQFKQVNKWARWITILQLIQMLLGFCVCLWNIYYLYLVERPCHVDTWNLLFGLFIYTTYMILFLQYFMSRHTKRPRNSFKKEI